MQNSRSRLARGTYISRVSFVVDAGAYDRFMGRYSTPLGPAFADFAGIDAGQRVLDVGCGPGALTAELVRRARPESVAAVDPSPPFVAATRERHPGVDVRQASAEDMPFDGKTFDAALAQLVVHFMTDPVAGVREMARVTRSGGVVAACVWDLAGGQAPISPLWTAARELDPDVDDESRRAGAREGHLEELFTEAGLMGIEAAPLWVTVEHESFEEWWEPFTLGVGPAGGYTASLDEAARARLRERCRELLPPEPFSLTARAWAARGIA
jgi:SAM-dependent methyltransferase